MNKATVLIVPGLRDHVEQHWQTILARELEHVRMVPPMGRERIGLGERVQAIEREARAVEGPVIVVAHSAGTIAVAHWATRRTRDVLGALLVTPPDFETAMPEGYPTIDQLGAAGWLPIPREPLPFPTIVAASRSDPLAAFDRVAQLASAWEAELVDLGDVGHMNPQSGHGRWPGARDYIDGFARLDEAVERACWSQPLRF